MVLNKLHMTRRQLLMISGGIVAASALGGTGAFFLQQKRGMTVGPMTLGEQDVDLTIRFQHSEPRLKVVDIQAAWMFDEGSGYEFRDSSGQGHVAHITGHNWNTSESGLTAAHQRAGKRGGAVYLNGACWLQVQHKETLDTTGQMSVAAWIKLDEEPSALAWSSIVQKLQDNLGYALLLGDKGNVRFAVRDEKRVDHMVESKENSIARDRWIHIVGCVDAGKGQFRLYVNGELAGSVEGAGFTPGHAEADLMIGRSAWLREAFKGWIDEVVVQKRVLTTEEVKELYLVGLPVLYSQTRETIDEGKRVWSMFKGNELIPHPSERDTFFSLHFNGDVEAEQGHKPTNSVNMEKALVPGYFGGAFDASVHAPLSYDSPIKDGQGTLEMWFIPIKERDDLEREKRKVVWRAEGEEAWIELATEQRCWRVEVGVGKSVRYSVQGQPQKFPYEQLMHVGVTWGQGKLVLYVNGVEVGQTKMTDEVVFDRRMMVGGVEGALAYGYIDDMHIANRVRKWGEICPRGHIDTEAAALDLMDACNHVEEQPLFWWQSVSEKARWRYGVKEWEDESEKTGNDPVERRALVQDERVGLHALIHPDGYGHMSSIEVGVSFAEKQDGWAGVFIQAEGIQEQGLSGYSFALNPEKNSMRLGVYQQGKLVAEKKLPYDFTLTVKKTYTLTLTSINDGVLRGYIDGNNVIAWKPKIEFSKGYAGLFTENASAFFDDIHLRALTPPVVKSRRVQQRVFVDGEALQERLGYDALGLSAFRWHKRTGVLPWKRTTKEPQPAGCLFSADDGVEVPNPPAFWRSEDSANTDILNVDGEILLIMRGNPRFEYGHGPASLGVHRAVGEMFDGMHFVDPAPNVKDLDKAQLLRGRRDTAPEEMRDADYRRERFQVNDQGAAYVGNGEVLVFAREFRNAVGAYPWYHRLIYGMYDVKKGVWRQKEAQYVEWSKMDPADTLNSFEGIDGTPDLVALRDPESDEYILFLFHQHKTVEGVPTTGITGLRFDKQRTQIVLDPKYPTRASYTKLNADVIYGERVLFDNGIYFVHYNDDSGYIEGDWPDRYALAATLHPYSQAWVNSADNKRPYFQRGGQFDCDNAAIWGGQAFKHRGRYYMYYEAFHAIDDVDAPYQNYDHVHAGSRVCFATGN